MYVSKGTGGDISALTSHVPNLMMELLKCDLMLLLEEGEEEEGG